MDLHYSQTDENIVNSLLCFTTLWIYTTLKPQRVNLRNTMSFTTLWIYTTLKRGRYKLVYYKSFTTLWIYTTLKPVRRFYRVILVLLPYGFTLLSNIVVEEFALVRFYYLMDLHYSQTIE